MAETVVGNAGLDRARGTERLAAFSRVATDTVDQAADEIGRIFCPHDLKPLRASGPDFFALHNCAAFDGFSINYVAYGGSVSIDPGCLERFFLVQLPLHGAALLSPTMPTRMVWQNDCAQLILLVERKLVEQRAAALAGGAVRAVEFDPV